MELAVRKLLNHARRAVHIFREKHSIPENTVELGVQVKIVGGSYRKGAETVTFNNVTIMKLVGNNIIIESDQVLVGAFTKFMPNFSADVFKTSWAQYKHNNPGAA